MNTILEHLGIAGQLWFQSPSLSKPSLTLFGIWGFGNTMIIFLAALLDVPKHLYESAELDGAGWRQRLRWVTLPTISPVILFAVVIGVIEGLQFFSEGYVASTVAAGGASKVATMRPTTLAIPRTRPSSTRCSSTSRGSATSTWATPRRWPCMLLVRLAGGDGRDPAALGSLRPLRRRR